MKIFLTDQAKSVLIDIHKYYTQKVSEQTASRVVNSILDAIEELERLPSIGAIEGRLAKYKLNHKYIVAGNYKIIFRIEGDLIYINDIFDGRRDPNLIAKRNK